MPTTAKNYTRRDPTVMHDVRENGRKLAILYTVEVEVARLIGLWIPKIREIPEKLWLGQMLHEDAEHAMWIERRLEELRVPPATIAGFRRRTVSVFLALEAAKDADTFLRGLFLTVKPALLADYQRHIEACPPYVDDPSVRFLRRQLAKHHDLDLGGAIKPPRRRCGTMSGQPVRPRLRPQTDLAICGPSWRRPRRPTLPR